jgi:hypothetical protein
LTYLFASSKTGGSGGFTDQIPSRLLNITRRFGIAIGVGVTVGIKVGVGVCVGVDVSVGVVVAVSVSAVAGDGSVEEAAVKVTVGEDAEIEAPAG